MGNEILSCGELKVACIDCPLWLCHCEDMDYKDVLLIVSKIIDTVNNSAETKETILKLWKARLRVSRISDIIASIKNKEVKHGK